MNRFLAIATLASAVFAITAPSAPAAAITGSYSVSDTTGSAAWSIGAPLGGDSDGGVPVRLTSASAPDVVRPCDGLNGLGTATTRVAGVADAAAHLRLAILFDLRRGTGRITLRPEVQRSGQVLTQEITACEPPIDAGNGTVSSTYDAGLMFANLFAPRMWAIERQGDGSWKGAGAQRFETQEHRMNVRITGSAAALNAGCLLPGVSELRLLRTAGAARRLVARAGFTRPRTDVRASRTVPRGRYLIAERVSSYALCGSRTITLSRSSGRP